MKRRGGEVRTRVGMEPRGRSKPKGDVQKEESADPRGKEGTIRISRNRILLESGSR